ncbi:hypothetical protein T08_3164 [Trichinella sp. T8]|nr:hypothetical protein T08_3164 [Trichinella sp. T8]
MVCERSFMKKADQHASSVQIRSTETRTHSEQPYFTSQMFIFAQFST